MKFKCQRELLLKGIQTVQRASSSKSTLPILSGILIETREEDLRFSGTDLELSIEAYVKADSIEEKGDVVLPGRYLLDIVRRLSGDLVSMERQAGEAVTRIECNRSIFEICGMDAAEFPLFPEVKGGRTLAIPGPILRSLVKGTVFAAAQDESRPFLTGVFMEVGDGITMVATDSFRLAYRKWRPDVPQEHDNIRGGGVIIPARCLQELIRITDDFSVDVRVEVGENQIAFVLDSATLVSRLIEGRFPNYRQVIPGGWLTRAFLDTQRLTEIIDRASVFGKEDFGVVRLFFKGDRLEVTSESPELGRTFEELDLEKEGEDIAIVLRSRYLLDALKVMEGERVGVEATGSTGPMCIRDTKMEDSFCLIMPVSEETGDEG